MASPRSITSRGSGASDPDLSPEGSDPVFVSTAQEKIRLTKAEETCLASLFCRVQDANSTQPILGDVYAQATFSRCEFDQGRTTVSGVQQSGTVLYASHRALRLDTWCEEFLLSREDPVTVLYLGCGLDCRYLRIRDRLRGREKQPEFRWIDIDTPMVVDLRRRVFAQPPGDYLLRTLDLSSDVWPRDLPLDRPTFVIAEGLLMYLEPELVERLFCNVVKYFPGGEIAFDKLGTLSVSLSSRVKFLKSSKAAFKWGVDEPEMIEKFHPKLKLKECRYKNEYLDGCIPMYGKLNSLVSLHPGDKYNGGFLRFEF